MKILVINLDRSPERLAHMRQVFAEHELFFERVPAVDGRMLGQSEIERWRQGVPNFYQLGPGEVACFLSHRRCWEIAASGPDEYTVICEDDIFLGRNAAAIFSEASWIPAGAGIVKLETSYLTVILAKDETARIDNRKVYRLLHDTSGGACYVISAETARRLLNASDRICDPVDQFLFNGKLPHSHGEVVYQLVPAIAVQEMFAPHLQKMFLGSHLIKDRPANNKAFNKRMLRRDMRRVEQPARKVRQSFMRWFADHRRERIQFR